MSPSLLLLLLLGCSSSSSSAHPDSSSASSREGLLVHFSDPELRHVSALLLSGDGSTLYVGAQDAILALNVSARDRITLKHKVQWSPTKEEVQDCTKKAKNATVDCPNFVGVLLQINRTHLYACGSHAYSPQEVYIDVDSFSMSPETNARGRCPSNPFEKSTAIAIGGELFTATTTDFKGQVPSIARFFTKGGRPDVSQESSSDLLEEPTFVRSSLDAAERKLYFFFSEVGKEFKFEDEIRIPRVAQVCKDDVGGQRTLQRRWTSLAKSSLLCPSQKSLPFSQLQDVFMLQPEEGANAADTLFYGVFSSEWAAAVCVFSLQQLRSVFSSYRTFDKKTSQWTPYRGQLKLGQCGLENATDSALEVVRQSFLTSSTIRPRGGGPVLVSAERYRRVVATVARGANGREYSVLFLLSDSGFLHKVVLFQDGAHVVEEIRVFTKPPLFYNLLLSGSKDVVYIATSDGVTAAPLVYCALYTSCLGCVLTRDPQCGWSRSRKACGVLDSSGDMVQVLEDGSVEEACRDQAGPVTKVAVHLKDRVTLPCPKPHKLASITWTSPQFPVLSEEVFSQGVDDLTFLAGAETLGTYQCHARVGRLEAVVATFHVLQVASPRSFTPPVKDHGMEEIEVPEEGEVSGVTSPPSHEGTDDQQGALCQQPGPQASLVVVSLLLVVCVCFLSLAALHTWCRRSQRLRWSKGQPEVGQEGLAPTSPETLS